MAALNSLNLLLLGWVVCTMTQTPHGLSKKATPKKEDREGYNATMLLDRLLVGYDRRLRPDFGGPATLVDVNLNIRSMGPISERDMAYQMDCYFRQSWVDKRLEFNHSSLPMLAVSINFLERLWKPDTHFFNGRRSYLHTVTTPNKLLRIAQDGRILYSMRLTVKASCPMHLESFPMDRQTCPLKFGSHGYSVDEMTYIWTHGPEKSIKMASDMALSQFDLIGFPAGNETMSQPPRGPVSVLVVHFSLRRHMGYFLINVYVPCSLLVILSWVAFWINREATSDRIALGITTVLTMAFLSIDNRHDLPKVSYSTALDYFVGACFTFVLATIIQFAGVHFFTKHGSGEIIHASDSEDEDDDSMQNTSNCYVNRHTSQPVPRRCVVTGKPNGETNISLQYEPDIQHFDTREPCLHKFWNCLKGSATYRHTKMKTSQSNGINSNTSNCYVNRHTSQPVPRRCVVTGKPNGETNISLQYEPDIQHFDTREPCLHKFWNCLKGSATYRHTKMKTSQSNGINSVSTIDRMARVLFPVSFFTFNVLYWTIYLNADGSEMVM